MSSAAKAFTAQRTGKNLRALVEADPQEAAIWAATVAGPMGEPQLVSALREVFENDRLADTAKAQALKVVLHRHLDLLASRLDKVGSGAKQASKWGP